MKRSIPLPSFQAVLAILALGVPGMIAGGWWSLGSGPPTIHEAEAVTRQPHLHPDYTDITLPWNIAPLNFMIREEGSQFFVRIHAEIGDAIEISSHSPAINLPLGRWRSLLQANRGRDLQIEVFAELNGEWQSYQPVVNHIAEEEIDSQLIYRLVGPIHNFYSHTAIRQRDLTGFEDTPIIEGHPLDGCVNCHSFVNHDSSRMSLALRGNVSGTLVTDRGQVEKLTEKFGYTAWHPTGNIAVYTVNMVRQFFHLAAAETRDVVEMQASLAYYRTEKRQSNPVPHASNPKRLETYPTWSPDGKYLYYCSAPRLWSEDTQVPPQRYQEIKYDLRRMRYDIEADRWGEPETVLSAEKTGLSILIPRISPNGRFLLFCMCPYGVFPNFQPQSDLYLLDLAKGTYSKPPINSEWAESWHSWSSNSRWIAFSSKRGTGLLTRTHFSYVDAQGRAHKPFVLPQQDPEFYDSLLKSFCVPELVAGPVPLSQAAFSRAARSKGKKVDVTNLPQSQTGETNALH